VAVGFAFRDIFQNFLAGILLLLTQPFHVGDRIQVKGYDGVVEDIQTRATRIRNDDGELVVVPNATLFTESVTVRRRGHRRRLEVEFSLKGASIGDAKTRILEAIRALPSVAPDSHPEVLVSAISPDSVTFKVRWWITGKTRGTESKNQVMEAIQQVLAAKEEEEKAEQATDSAQPTAQPA
jgi:small-conductance mechanosensitive channel